MVILDIVVVAILAWALYSGLKDGVIVQLSGIVGVFIGAYLAFRFAPSVGNWLALDSSYSTIAGFALVLLGVIITMALIARVVRKLVGIVGLGLIDRVGGALFSLLKVGLVLGLLFFSFDSLNSSRGWVQENKLNKSTLYRPLVNVATSLFPYIKTAAKNLLPDSILDDQTQEQEQEQEQEQREDSENSHTI